MCTGVTGVLQFVLTTGVNSCTTCTGITKYIIAITFKVMFIPV